MIRLKKWNNTLCTALLILGIVSFGAGLYGFLVVKPDGSNVNRLLGMFTGAGFGIMLVALWKTAREKLVSKQKLEQEKIEMEDERNIAIGHAAGTIGYITGTLLLGIMTFLFTGLGDQMAAYIALLSLYVLVLVGFAARKVLEKKM